MELTTGEHCGETPTAWAGMFYLFQALFYIPDFDRWEGLTLTVHRVRTICPYCGVGCGLYFLVDQGRIVGVEPDPEHPVSQGELCLKGYYGYNHVSDPRRLQTPLIRKNGTLVPTTWDEALDFIADHLNRVRQHDPDAFALIASAKGTNEDNFAAQKFARVVMGTNNVDTCARL